MHFANGEPCSCKMTPTEDGAEFYAAHHPNKEPNFNAQIAATIKKSNETRVL